MRNDNADTGSRGRGWAGWIDACDRSRQTRRECLSIKPQYVHRRRGTLREHSVLMERLAQRLRQRARALGLSDADVAPCVRTDRGNSRPNPEMPIIFTTAALMPRRARAADKVDITEKVAADRLYTNDYLG